MLKGFFSKKDSRPARRLGKCPRRSLASAEPPPHRVGAVALHAAATCFHGVGGGVRAVRGDAIGVKQRLLSQGDGVAQLLPDGSLRGTQRGRQIDAVAVPNVQLRRVHRAPARGVTAERRGGAEDSRAPRTPS